MPSLLIVLFLFNFVPVVTWRVCDPLAHGAVGTGLVYDTDGVRAAIDECAVEGGTVLFAAGKTFLTGAFNVSSNMELRVDGKLLGSPNATGYTLMDYLPWYGPDPSMEASLDTREWSPFIGSWYASNVSITGTGIIDGNGAQWWKCASNVSHFPCSGHPRPHGIRFVGGQHFLISGVSIMNSPMWQVHLAYVTDAHVRDVRITAPSSEGPDPSHNTDGIDPDCSQDVLVERVYISTGDDNIAVKSGRDWFGRTFGRPSRNITIRDSVFGTGHGLSIGSEMSGGVYNVLFSNITAVGGPGVRIKSERGRGGSVNNITFRDITLKKASTAVQITDNYQPGLPPTNASATPRISNVTIENLLSINSSSGYFLDGLPESPIQGLTLRNVTLEGTSPSSQFKKCDNVDKTTSSCSAGVLPSCPPCVK